MVPPRKSPGLQGPGVGTRWLAPLPPRPPGTVRQLGGGTQLIHPVQQGEPGVAQGHARACVAHDVAYALAHGLAVAVDLASVAHRLFLVEGAGGESAVGIIPKPVALWAKRAATAVPIPAGDLQHGVYRAPFLADAGAWSGHGQIGLSDTKLARAGA